MIIRVDHLRGGYWRLACWWFLPIGGLVPAVSVVLPLWRPHDEISTTASSDRDHRCPLTPTFIPWTCQTLELSMACPHTYPRTTRVLRAAQ